MILFYQFFFKLALVFFKKKFFNFNLKFFKIQLSKQISFHCVCGYFLHNFFLKMYTKSCFFENNSICIFNKYTNMAFRDLNSMLKHFKKNLLESVFIFIGFNLLKIDIFFSFFLINFLEIFMKYFKFILQYFQPIILKIIKHIFYYKNKQLHLIEKHKLIFFYAFLIKFYNYLLFFEKKNIKKDLDVLVFYSFKNFDILW